MRCTQDAFNAIVSRVEERWLEVNRKLDPFRTVFDIGTRVAITMHFLTHEFRQSAQTFGTSKTQAYEYVEQVLKVIELYKTIRLLNTDCCESSLSTW
jgi:hypothetical protein